MAYSELMVAPMRKDLVRPSSPSAAILRNGELVYMMERHEIEGHTPHEIADTLKAAFDHHCG